MDSNFNSYHDAKSDELKKDVKSRVQYVDNEVTRLACFEVLDELTQYLTHRYLEVFQLRDGFIHNTVTGEKFPYPAANPTEAMVVAAKLVQDDLVVMIENDEGHYHIDAGAVCLPGFWSHFRSERQSLRRLPKSKALLFTIRMYFEPVTVIAQEPHVPGRLAEAIRSWDETVSYYKGRSHWEGLLLPYLDEMHEKQMETGMLEGKQEGEFPF